MFRRISWLAALLYNLLQAASQLCECLRSQQYSVDMVKMNEPVIKKKGGEQRGRIWETCGTCPTCTPHPIRTWQGQTGRNRKINLSRVIISGHKYIYGQYQNMPDRYQASATCMVKGQKYSAKNRKIHLWQVIIYLWQDTTSAKEWISSQSDSLQFVHPNDSFI